jgi:predicted transcriptional regulator YheO
MSSLTPYFAIADGLAALFKPFVEAVVHDLRTDCVAYVAHPFSPREAGDPSDMEDVTFAEGVQVIGPYEKVNFDGRRIKSISILLRGEKNKAIGMLCINADVTEFEAVRRMLQGFLGVSETTTQVSTLFHEDWHEKVNRFVAAWTAERSTTLDRLDRAGRRALIEALQENGAFEGRRAAAYVAKILGVSRATVYNELARLKISIAA